MDVERGNFFLTGVNYWPRSSAMAMWSRYNPAEIAEDFDRIADLGLDVVRFFLLWEAFSPTPDTFNEASFACLADLLDKLAERNLLGMPTLFCGHMSGVNFLPTWTLDRGRPAGRFRTISAGVESPFGIGDFYSGELLEAQVRFAAEVGRRCAGHRAIFAWDLGNEFTNLREPASSADAAQWSRRLSTTLAQTSGHDVTGGTHGEDLTLDRRLRLSTIAAPWKFATMHGYSVYSDFAHGRLDANVVPFLSTLAATFAEKPVLFSEFGNPTCPLGTVSPGDGVELPPQDQSAPNDAVGETRPDTANGNSETDINRTDLQTVPEASPNSQTSTLGTSSLANFACLTESEMCDYAERAFEALWQAGALGGFWWCWADYSADLVNEPPFDRALHELHFGIIRNDGSYKPIAETLRRIAHASKTRRVRPRVQALPTNETEYYAALPSVTRRLYDAYTPAGGGRPMQEKEPAHD